MCSCADTIRFLNADEHNTAIKHAIQEDLSQALATNLHTEETRAKLEAREHENANLVVEIESLLREITAVQARKENCEVEINALRPMVGEQVTSFFTSWHCRYETHELLQAESIETKSRETLDLSKKKQACLEQVLPAFVFVFFKNMSPVF